MYPIGSMDGIFTYIWLIFRVNVGKYTIHGSHGYVYKHVFSDIHVHGILLNKIFLRRGFNDIFENINKNTFKHIQHIHNKGKQSLTKAVFIKAKGFL